MLNKYYRYWLILTIIFREKINFIILVKDDNNRESTWENWDQV